MRDEALIGLVSAMLGGKKGECKYYPCHFEGQDCTFCFCPFYPCLYYEFGRLKDMRVWSCMECNWIHEKDNVETVLEYFSGIPVQKIVEMDWLSLNRIFQELVFGEEVGEFVGRAYSLLRMNEKFKGELIDVKIEDFKIAEVRKIRNVEEAEHVILPLYDPGLGKN